MMTIQSLVARRLAAMPVMAGTNQSNMAIQPSQATKALDHVYAVQAFQYVYALCMAQVAVRAFDVVQESYE